MEESPGRGGGASLVARSPVRRYHQSPKRNEERLHLGSSKSGEEPYCAASPVSCAACEGSCTSYALFLLSPLLYRLPMSPCPSLPCLLAPSLTTLSSLPPPLSWSFAESRKLKNPVVV